MKIYVNSELKMTLDNEDEIENCLNSYYCYEDRDGLPACIMSEEDWAIFEEELENEDDNQLECWIP